MDIEQLGYRVIGCAIEAHKSLGGCGLLESLYEDAMCYELAKAGIIYERQVTVPVQYKDVILNTPLKLDLAIERRILVGCKSTLQYNSIFDAQLLTYLRLANYKLGYVINFGEPILKNGIHRIVN